MKSKVCVGVGIKWIKGKQKERITKTLNKVKNLFENVNKGIIFFSIDFLDKN